MHANALQTTTTTTVYMYLTIQSTPAHDSSHHLVSRPLRLPYPPRQPDCARHHDDDDDDDFDDDTTRPQEATEKRRFIASPSLAS